MAPNQYIKRSRKGDALVALKGAARSSLPWPLPPENVRSPVGGCHDVYRSILVQIDRQYRRSYTRAVMDQLGLEFRAAGSFGVAYSPEPVQDRRAERIGVRIAFEVRVQALSHDEVRNAVPIHELQGWSLRRSGRRRSRRRRPTLRPRGSRPRGASARTSPDDTARARTLYPLAAAPTTRTARRYPCARHR